MPTAIFRAGSKPVISQESTISEVTYPDLSAYEVDGDEPEVLPESIPGTFAFRADHTIQVQTPSKGFGAAAGQASLRQVRKSVDASARMPGSFPRASDISPNKENKDPLIHNGIPHGMANKKRHRASSEEAEEDEGSKRGMKKLRKNPPAAEGDGLHASDATNTQPAEEEKDGSESQPASYARPAEDPQVGGYTLPRPTLVFENDVAIMEYGFTV
ncbi:hypothetical protein NUW58_g10214 [Xylaria curta]|uniref:Uncharacterized protein n=1 Tax=Xylaria curta TaxID=42375 RepID=A0ACC1MQH1_9PEZI|nr:hypothetical protein NUW58_g10214 [Xylaria curta]